MARIQRLMIKRCLVSALTLAFTPQIVRGAVDRPPPLVIDGRPFVADLGPHVSLLRDPAGTLAFAEASSEGMAGNYKPASATVPSLGFTTDVIWSRFVIESRSDREESVLVELGMPRMHEWQWFIEGTGLAAPGSGESRSRFPMIAITLEPGAACAVYARARSDTSIWLPLVAGSPAAFAGYAARRDFRDFSQAGFCFALALMGLGLWAGRRRNRLYLGVALAMVGALLYLTIFNGLYAWLGGPFSNWMGRQGILVSVLLFALMFAKFTQDFIGRKNLPGAGNSAFAACYGLIAVTMVLCVVLPYSVTVKLAQPVHLLAIAVAAGVTLRQAIMARGPGMGLFVTAWAVLLSGTVFFMLQLHAIVPVVPVSPYDTLMFVFSSVFLLFLLAGANSQRAALRMEARVAGLQRAEIEARLAALRNQLDPHFLFNTLASVEELSHEAPERIPSLVGRLAAFLRRRLGPDAASADVALSDEIAAVRDYLAIEQVRFEERLVADFDIEPAAADCAVPELVLLPLVENAVKHGFAGTPTLHIRVSARLLGGTLRLRVENNGCLQPVGTPPNGTRTGIENLRTRLQLRHGKAASFSIREEVGGVVAEVSLPAREGKL